MDFTSACKNYWYMSNNVNAHFLLILANIVFIQICIYSIMQIVFHFLHLLCTYTKSIENIFIRIISNHDLILILILINNCHCIEYILALKMISGITMIKRVYKSSNYMINKYIVVVWWSRSRSTAMYVHLISISSF